MCFLSYRNERSLCLNPAVILYLRGKLHRKLPFFAGKGEESMLTIARILVLTNTRNQRMYPPLAVVVHIT